MCITCNNYGEHIYNFFQSFDQYLRYYIDTLGFVVIPVHYGTKRPAVKWGVFRERPPSRTEMYNMFIGKQYNIAVINGVVSRNLVVIDFDSMESFRKIFNARKVLEETLVVKTGSGRGVHVYFRSEEPVPTFKLPRYKIDVRGEGSIAILPPSRHESGGYYQLLSMPESIPVITDFYNTLIRRFKEVFGNVDIVHQDGYILRDIIRRVGRYRGRDPPCIYSIKLGVKEGIRNESAIRYASYLIHFRGLSEKSVWRILREWNKRNMPPLDEKELMRCLKQAVKYVYGCRSHKTIMNCDKKRCSLYKKYYLKPAWRLIYNFDVRLMSGKRLSLVI